MEFEKLPTDLEDELAEIVTMHGDDSPSIEAPHSPVLDELAEMGYLSGYSVYYDGNAEFRLSNKAKAYFERKKERERQKRDEEARSLAKGVVGGIAGIVGKLMGR